METLQLSSTAIQNIVTESRTGLKLFMDRILENELQVMELELAYTALVPDKEKKEAQKAVAKVKGEIFTNALKQTRGNREKAYKIIAETSSKSF